MRNVYPGKRKSLVLAIMMAGTALPVAAQEPEIEEVVVTGSLIRGTPLDAALPVEVFSAAELQETGSPTALDFVKTLTAGGPVTGEAYYFGGSGNTGNVSFNLRGIGSDKTLTLFNGRRTPQNSSVFPSSVTSRIEILKDGAAVTYGADATGGVVNFITEDNFEGFELSSSYKGGFDSDGDWSVSAKAGWDVGDSNLMVAAEWDHRSRLQSGERDFASLPYGVNPAPWSGLTNLAGWVPRAGLPATPGNTANSEWGTPLGLVSDFTQSSCEAVGGVFVGAFTCNYGYIPFYNIVEENEIYRLFGQITTQMSDSMEFYARAAYSRVHTPEAYGSPSQPVVRGPAQTSGLTYQLYAPVTNPYVDEFVQRSGWANNPLSAITQGFTPITYRAFAHGGNDTFASDGLHSTPNENEARYWHISTGLTGEFENQIAYDFAITYNQFDGRASAPDIMGARLQNALYGFGGPNCNVQDQNPDRLGTQNPALAGVGDCMYWNPFASNFASQPELGLANPSYDPSLQNPQELREWIFNERYGETTSWNATVDLVFSGQTGIELPGGNIAWGAGVQYRDTKNRQTVPDPIYNGATPCFWPEQRPLDPNHPEYNGCTPDGPGPFFFFGINEPDSTTQDQRSAFAEFNLPLLDSLQMTAAVRHEAFSGDLSATVYKVSGKYDMTDNLSFRGSYGTNYQAPGADLVPGEVNTGVNSYTIAGGDWRGATTITATGIEPETATVWSTGAIWQSEGFDASHDFQFIVDYFSIETEDELGLLASANTIADSVFSIPPPGSTSVPTNRTALADCSHPLIGRVQFNGGACNQGVTTANDFASITTEFGNGPGQTTNGFDIQARYSFPAFAGDMRLGLTLTKVEEFTFGETVLDGFQLDPGDERLGTLNFATIAQAAPEWRANLNVNYGQGDHNFRFVLSYIDGVKDERYYNDDGSINEAGLVPSGFQPGTTTPFGPSFYGVDPGGWLSGDLHWIWDHSFATFSASVTNITDEAPPASRQEFGYDPRIGNPLGRVFEVGIRKTF
ncbi:hypothetical protein PHACT_07015 [Pseudohongiella acticola]|jgi:iron complex outermembrane recepter protein|uniref:TonB-dependent receptor n=1 Tax=Pseudohongiella acticola TaxID=1524254 RepID=A0A1E8CKJ9_9GAMM|nr:TonB-dependent receptor [Pseudohongiella acticola]OFE12923.1 hypothetical protein PHACT_07015 [Pseudohongiella acticola]